MEFLDEIIDLLNSGKPQEVIDIISDYLDENPQYKTIDYYHFANPLEETLFDFYIKELKSVKTLDLFEPLDEIYQIYAIAHAMKGDLDSAEKYLNIANQINPVSAQILMSLCELYQEKNQEEKLKSLTCDIFKYAYDRELLISNYFKLADYLFHTNKNPELYDHLFNFFMFLKTGDEAKPVKEDIIYFKKNNVPVGFNKRIISMLLYLIDIHSQQGMENAAEYFKNMLKEVVEFNKDLNNIEPIG